MLTNYGLSFRCKFKGTKADVLNHLKDCRFESMKEILNEKDEQLQQLQDMVLHRNDQIDNLQRIIDSLLIRVDKIERSLLLFSSFTFLFWSILTRILFRFWEGR